MIYERFRASGAYDAIQDLSQLFNIRLQNDYVQVFDVRWDQAPILGQWATYRYGPGRIVQVKVAGFCSASRLYWLCTIKKLFETKDNRVIQDWRQLWGFILIKRWEHGAAELETKLLQEEW